MEKDYKNVTQRISSARQKISALTPSIDNFSEAVDDVCRDVFGAITCGEGRPPRDAELNGYLHQAVDMTSIDKDTAYYLDLITQNRMPVTDKVDKVVAISSITAMTECVAKRFGV